MINVGGTGGRRPLADGPVVFRNSPSIFIVKVIVPYVYRQYVLAAVVEPELHRHAIAGVIVG